MPPIITVLVWAFVALLIGGAAWVLVESWWTYHGRWMFQRRPR